MVPGVVVAVEMIPRRSAYIGAVSPVGLSSL